MDQSRHFDPLRPNRFVGSGERYEFTHGVNSVCVYDIHTMEFIKEIPVGPTPDCHSTSIDNRYLYIACVDGLYCIDQSSLSVASIVDTGYVFATNVLPDGNTMLLHDAYGGMLILKDINDIDRIRIHKRVDMLKTNTVMDTLGGKGHFIGDGRYYLCAGWEHPSMFVIDLLDNYSFELFIENDMRLKRGDDVVVSKDKTRAYVACYQDECHLAVIDIESRQIIKTIRTGSGTCGLTMSNDERYVIASNDQDNSISVIDTISDELANTVSVNEGFKKLGIAGLIQGISVGQNDEIYLYGCSGTGALVRFDDITGTGRWTISYRGGMVSG